MKPSQLKKLAEWYADDKAPFTFKQLGLAVWQPHKDSNQLDQLEDKMAEELGRLELDLASDGARGIVIARHCYVKDGIIVHITAEGKTKNEARLNAILNYVEGIK